MYSIEKFYTDFYKPGILCTDSRMLRPGGIFVALKGDHFNGNEFAEAAIADGAKVAIIDDKSHEHVPNTILVDDSLKFLQNLAKYHRKKSGFHVVGITGSNGKTTTKELIKAVLSEKFKCQSTEGNLNNHIGVPITVLAINDDTDYAIIEMGANHRGEIKELCEICLPDSGLITNIGNAHLGGFGGFEGVKKTKAELFDFLKKRKDKIYYNASNPILTELVNGYQNAVPFGTESGLCQGKIESVDPTLKILLTDKANNSINIESNLFGEYNFENLLAAASIGIDLGLTLTEIKKGIEKFKPSNNRSQLIKLGSTTMILDCYNANPSSMKESLVSFSKLHAENKILILGGMKELGVYSESEHKKLGEIIETYKFNEIILVGDEFKEVKIINSRHFNSVLDLKGYINKTRFQNTCILVKGSRASKLEKVLEFFD
jgi:UDP-N-acetylmuramoyl-tripeptide--D-alanyl-D-alanine ligase